MVSYLKKILRCPRVSSDIEVCKNAKTQFMSLEESADQHLNCPADQSPGHLAGLSLKEEDISK